MTLLHRCLLATVAAALLGLAAGCATQAQPVGVVTPQGQTGQLTYVRSTHILTDPKMERTVDVSDPNIDTTPEGLLRVQLTLTNLTSDYQSVEYQYVWTDAHGMLVDVPTSRWVMAKLKPKDTIMVVAVAPSPAVKDFQFKTDIRR